MPTKTRMAAKVAKAVKATTQSRTGSRTGRTTKAGTADLAAQLAGLFDPATDDKPDALGPEDVDDDGQVIPR